MSQSIWEVVDFSSERFDLMKQLKSILSHPISIQSVKDMNDCILALDPDGWIKFSQTALLLSLSDIEFKKYYSDEIATNTFGKFNGFDLTEKVIEMHSVEQGLGDDEVFKDGIDLFVDLKRVEYILDNEFSGYNIDAYGNLKEFLNKVNIKELIGETPRYQHKVAI